MKKLVALLLSVMMCFACVSALADTYVSWYTYGDVYLSSVRSEMEADFAKLNLTINGSDANGNQQVQSDFISTALMNNDCEAIVVNLVESGAISTAQTIMNQIQAAGIPTVWFNRPVSTNNEEAANLFLNNPASAFVGTNFEDAGVMQGELIGQYLVEHYNDIDLNGDGKISYIMFKGDEANQEAIARTALAVEYANKALVAAGKPEIEFYDASNANKYLVDPNGSWSNVFSSEQMQTVLSMYNEGNGNMVDCIENPPQRYRQCCVITKNAAAVLLPAAAFFVQGMRFAEFPVALRRERNSPSESARARPTGGIPPSACRW